MSRCQPPAILAALILALVALHPLSAGPAAQQTTFRSGATAVAVDVTVRNSRRGVITGLTAEDFQVFDNGVLQQVDQVSYGRLPIDVTIALDVSYSVTGNLLDQLRRGVVQLMRDLGPEDRLKLVLFNMRVARSTDFTTDVAEVERAIGEARAGGSTALLDAISVALVSGSAPDRRQLVVFFTDGTDSSSATTPVVLTAIAQRTRGTLAFVVPGLTVRSSVTGVTRIDRRPRLQALFTTLARETGGAVLPVDTTANLTAAFRRVLADFRSAYVLYYHARGVDPGGYHTIEVKVSREGAVVNARRGYFSSSTSRERSELPRTSRERGEAERASPTTRL